MAGPVAGHFAERYRAELLDLPWTGEWDAIFLLDVLEHIPEHLHAMKQAFSALRPGGLLCITVPARDEFWSYNDDIAGHVRRYRKSSLRMLGRKAGLRTIRDSYFMFLLGPLMQLSRKLTRPRGQKSPQELREHLERTHRVPPSYINSILASVFLLESRLISRMEMPFGASLLSIMARPDS